MRTNTELEPGILVAEDVETERFLIQHAFDKAGIRAPLQLVNDGREVVDYLTGEGPYTDRLAHPLPGLLILDLNMPRMTGFDVLAWLAGQPDFKHLPAVILSSSGLESDIAKARQLGASDYHVKPHTLGELAQILQSIEMRWLSSAVQASPGPL